MSPCTNQAQFTAFNAIDEQPVGFNMTFPAILEGAFQTVISILNGKFFSFQQEPDECFQTMKVLSSFFEAFHISFELVVTPDGAHG